MKKMLPVVLVFCAAMGLFPEEQKGEIRQSILSVLQKQEIAWNQGNIDGFMTHYWKSDMLTFQSSKEKILGWDTMIKRYKKKYLPNKMGKIRFFDINVRVLAPGAAVVVGKVKDLSSDLPYDALFTLVFQKMSGRWLIVLDHTS